MTKTNELDPVLERAPELRNPDAWPELRPDVLERLTDLYVREAPEVAGGDVQPAAFRTLVRTVRLVSVASLLPPPMFPAFEWAGRHLALYFVAALYAVLISVVLWRQRARIAAGAALALAALAGVDALAWWRIFPELRDIDFPVPLAVIDTIAYSAVALAAHGLLKKARWSPHSPPSARVYVFFASYCFCACFYWILLSGPYRDGKLVAVLRRVWHLDALAKSSGFGHVDGVVFMTWLVWALYGVSGAVGLWLMLRRDSLRVTLRWLCVPCALYGLIGPWTPESMDAVRAVFALPLLAALADWLVPERWRRGE